MSDLFDKAFARVFGEGDDDEQAELLNGLGRALWNSCRRDQCDFNRQLCFLEDHLDVNGRRFIKALALFITGANP